MPVLPSWLMLPVRQTTRLMGLSANSWPRRRPPPTLLVPLSIRNAAIVEEALRRPPHPMRRSSVPAESIPAAVAESASADGMPDATITAGTATAPIDGAFVTSPTSTVLGTDYSIAGRFAFD